MILSRIALVSIALSGIAVSAQAQTIYEGSSFGSGAGRCNGYKMAVEVAVSGSAVKGTFQQEGRTQRHFEATADPSGAFKASAEVGGGGTMSVNGSLGPNGGSVLLDGYCRFETKLARRQP